MTVLTRRRLLAGTGALAVGGAILALPGLRGQIANVIERHFGPAMARTDAAAAFVEAQARAYEASLHRSDLIGGAAAFGVDIVDIGFRLAAAGSVVSESLAARLEEQVIGRFLHSTNFVETGSDASRLEFLGLFRPYDGACRNPLGRPSGDD